MGEEYTIIIEYEDGSEKDYELYNESEARDFFDDACEQLDETLLNEDDSEAVAVSLYCDDEKIDEYRV